MVKLCGDHDFDGVMKDEIYLNEACMSLFLLVILGRAAAFNVKMPVSSFFSGHRWHLRVELCGKLLCCKGIRNSTAVSGT